MIRKITTLTLILFPCFFVAKTQIQKKSMLIGGQAYYYSSDINYSGSQNNQKNKQALFNLSIGRAFQENSFYGLNLAYSPSLENNFFTGTTFVNAKIQQYSIGVFNRRYKKIANDFYFFAEFGAAYISAQQVNKDSSNVLLETITLTGGELTLTPGISYKILNKLYLEIIIPNLISIQYAITKEKTQTEDTTQKQFLFNSSLNLNSLAFLGVGFHFIL